MRHTKWRTRKKPDEKQKLSVAYGVLLWTFFPSNSYEIAFYRYLSSSIKLTWKICQKNANKCHWFHTILHNISVCCVLTFIRRKWMIWKTSNNFSRYKAQASLILKTHLIKRRICVHRIGNFSFSKPKKWNIFVSIFRSKRENVCFMFRYVVSFRWTRVSNPKFPRMFYHVQNLNINEEPEQWYNSNTYAHMPCVGIVSNKRFTSSTRNCFRFYSRIKFNVHRVELCGLRNA